MAYDFENTVHSRYIELPDSGDSSNKIHVRSAGIRPTPHAPTVVFVCGLGSGCLSFTAVQHQLAAAGISSFTYDRLGIGRSSPWQPIDDIGKFKARGAETLAREMIMVLRIADVQPPYILAPHSYGGVISWEFMSAHVEDIVGLVAIDANSARSCERPLRDQDLDVLSKNLPDGALDYSEIVGLDAANRLPGALWQEAGEKCAPPEPWLHGTGGEKAEMQVWFDSCRALQRLGFLEKHPLERHPVTVITGNIESDIRRLIDAAEALGGGTKEIRDDLRKRLEGSRELEADQQRDHLQLTDIGLKRRVEAKRSGHWVHITEPELVVDEITRMIRSWHV